MRERERKNGGFPDLTSPSNPNSLSRQREREGLILSRVHGFTHARKKERRTWL